MGHMKNLVGGSLGLPANFTNLEKENKVIMVVSLKCGVMPCIAENSRAWLFHFFYGSGTVGPLQISPL